MTQDDVTPAAADAADGADRAADQLADLLLALEKVDLNALQLDDDVRLVLDVKRDLRELCRRHRRADTGTTAGDRDDGGTR